jgi:hypothetical protein
MKFIIWRDVDHPGPRKLVVELWDDRLVERTRMFLPWWPGWLRSALDRRCQAMLRRARLYRVVADDALS